jgi:hypothetical protein
VNILAGPDDAPDNNCQSNPIANSGLRTVLTTICLFPPRVLVLTPCVYSEA